MNALAESPLITIVGPTASGKSALAVWLARQLGGEVVACDSTQLYRGFDVGTAKPTAEERQGVAHHLIDVLDPREATTAGDYRERAVAVLEDLRARKRLPIFTVGTGLYLRALLEGLADVPLRSEELRERLWASVAAHPQGHLHRILKRMDPVSAERIAPGDGQKLIRAVEVCLLAKKPLSEVHRAGRNPLRGWRAIKIGLSPERETLYQRIHTRTDTMLAAGWLDEVRGLVGSDLPADAKPFDFIGYRELRAVLNDEMKLEEAKAAIQQATRRYAKRQLTWFRRDGQIHWLSGFGQDPTIQQESLARVRNQL
ncbi:MAG TPA: tRNA (adenosine(37)-N6)-dimethylallyltransferase MiaA [Candidatus Limnocylindrales bacterium]|nr:tRNA (adenosine(37)-N6)-dimethylallyltransferase MiaA [Candidatus Limnocylindrales bacterium]